MIDPRPVHDAAKALAVELDRAGDLVARGIDPGTEPLSSRFDAMMAAVIDVWNAAYADEDAAPRRFRKVVTKLVCGLIVTAVPRDFLFFVFKPCSGEDCIDAIPVKIDRSLCPSCARRAN